MSDKRGLGETSDMYLEDLRIFCKELHYLPGIEIRALIEDKLRQLEADQRMQIPHQYDSVMTIRFSRA